MLGVFCTGELNVIVEYCHYGNLRTYLLKYKDSFVDTMEKLDSPQSEAFQPAAGDPHTVSYVNDNPELSAVGDGTDRPPLLTTKNLVCWSFQVARGMEYLSSKKVSV